MVKPELGTKRQCHNCGTKFFDFSRSPIECPKCGTIFQVAALPKAAAAARTSQPEDDVEADPAAAQLVPLEEADAGDEKAAAVVADDEIEIEDDPAEETFLEEEEEENDDVSDLIDGEIEDDEEG